MQHAAVSAPVYGRGDGCPTGMTVRRGSWPGRGGDPIAEGRSPADVERFRQLYTANYARLVGYALRRTQSHEEAADVVAETFLIAWRNLVKVPEDDGARLWLYATARRVLANQRRSQQRREQLAARIAFEIDTTPRFPVESDPSIVARALKSLSEEDRNLLGLVGWEGLRPAEIATVLGCSVGAVRIRMLRARRRLTQELQKLGYREDPTTGALRLASEEQ